MDSQRLPDPSRAEEAERGAIQIPMLVEHASTSEQWTPRRLPTLSIEKMIPLRNLQGMKLYEPLYLTLYQHFNRL